MCRASPDPQISVVVLCWNGMAHLRTCLDALRRQTLRGFEVIVVDNGSTDGSADFVAQHYPEVRVIRLRENLGFSAGNNVGIAAARGRSIALLNQDTEADERWLEELYRAMEGRPDVGSCASRMLRFDRRDLIDRAGDAYTVAGAGELIGSGMRDGEAFARVREVFGACAGAALYRRAMLEEVGGFDEDFFAVCEDMDLSFRAQLRGYRCLYIPTAVVYHKVSSAIGLYSDLYVYYTHRNLEYAFFKNMPARLLFRYLPLHLLYGVLSFLFYASRGRGWAFLRAKVAALRAMPGILTKRAEIQRRRTVPDAYIAALLERRWLRGRAWRAWGMPSFVIRHSSFPPFHPPRMRGGKRGGVDD